MVLAGRDPQWDLELTGAKVHMGTGGAALTVFDLETGEPRHAVLQDVVDLARLVDALDNIHFYLIPVFPTDLGRDDVDVQQYYAGLANTGKHVQSGVYSVDGIRDTVAMAERIQGGRLPPAGTAGRLVHHQLDGQPAPLCDRGHHAVDRELPPGHAGGAVGRAHGWLDRADDAGGGVGPTDGRAACPASC